jgi:hypothetical protein
MVARRGYTYAPGRAPFMPLKLLDPPLAAAGSHGRALSGAEAAGGRALRWLRDQRGIG